MKFEPTENQRKVMEAEGSNQIVSASAGSGKTTVMVELIAQRVVSKKIDLDRILLITFTNSATSDMKLKLSNKLNEIIKENPSSYIKKQFDKVASCRISTIDKLCQNIVKQYFYAIDISPSFNILSKEDMNLIRDKAFDRVLSKHIEAGNTEIIDLSMMLLKKRSQETLKQLVYDCYNFLQVQASVDDYINNVKNLYTLPIQQNPVVLYYNDLLKNINDKCVNELIRLKDWGDLSVNEYIDQLVSKISTFQVCFDLTSFNSFASMKKEKRDKELISLLNSTIKQYNSEIESILEVFGTFDMLDLEKMVLSTGGMLETLLNFTLEFQQEYRKLKRDSNSFEFNDIEHFALEILNRDELRESIIEDIDFIFVDEYQDVNELQDAIISRLSKGDNLFMVGDMKQSIYGFRLCAPYIFIDKYYNYLNGDGGQAHKLNENFRSSPKILKFVNDVFNKSMTKSFGGIDYANDGAFKIKESDVEEELKPINIHLINKTTDAKYSPDTIYSVMSSAQETTLDAYELEGNEILNIILDLLQKKIYDKSINDMRQITYSDIAILFRKRSKLYGYLTKKLSSLDIPISIDMKVEMFESFIAKFLNSVLRLLLAFNDDISLATVMKFDGFDFTDDELFEIRSASDKESFYEAVLDYSGYLKPRIDKMLSFFDNLADKVTYMTVTDIIYEIDKQIGLKNTLLAKEMGSSYVVTLNRFIEYVASLQYNSNIVEYLLYVQKLDGSKEAEITIGGGDAITFTTIHSSKGLEYPIVILADAGDVLKDKTTENPIIFHKEGIGPYYFDLENNYKVKSFMYNYLAKRKFDDELYEQIRLLYVALTRPKNILFITGCVSMNTFEKEGYIKSRCYLKYIMDGLDSLVVQSFLTAGEYTDEDIHICISGEKAPFVPINDSKEVNEELKELLIERFKFNYAHHSASAISYKTSATALSTNESPHSYTTNFDKLLVTDDEMDLNELGTLYHKVFELIDFMNATSEDNIKEQISDLGLLPSEVDAIDVSLIYHLKQQLSVFGEDLTLEKEKRFLYKTQYNNLVQSSDIKDEVLLQGVIDLIITTKEGHKYIVDYKLTTVSDETTVINRYRKQLEIYAKSLESALRHNINGAYLYLIRQGKLLKVF